MSFEFTEFRQIIERIEELPADLRSRRKLVDKLQEAMEAELPAPEECATSLTLPEGSIDIQPLSIVKNFDDNGGPATVGVSIVIPINNEQDNLRPLYRELIDSLARIKEESEIVFVDDGSVDGSLEILTELAEHDDRVKVIVFRKNFGQTAALSAGFKYARGAVIVAMDGDRQNDPADIPRLLEKMAEGYDLVSGWRANRQDKYMTRRLPSVIANRLINKLIEGSQVQLKDYGCTLKAYKKGLAKNINLYGEMHRFIPVFAALLGASIAEIEVNHRPRTAGAAKYNLSRISRVIFDLIVLRFFSGYLSRPIQFFGKYAKLLTQYGLAAILLTGLAKIWWPVPLSLDTLILLAGLILASALQMICIGILSEVTIRSYFEGQQKDYYVVKTVIDHRKSKACAGSRV